MSDKENNQQSLANQRLATIRHSVSHIMAQAVIRLYPGTRVAIGPSIENGFYYDFQFPVKDDGKPPITPEDLNTIEAEMKKIMESRQDFIKVTMSHQEALKYFADEQFKLELINDLPENEEITIYENRDTVKSSPDNTTTAHCALLTAHWADLCRGPHVQNTREIHSGAFKLMSIAGAYWRGDEKRPMLTRIYGTAWEPQRS